MMQNPEKKDHSTAVKNSNNKKLQLYDQNLGRQTHQTTVQIPRKEKSFDKQQISKRNKEQA